MRYIFDIEANDLLDKATKIHCFCYQDLDSSKNGQLTNYEDITQFLNKDDLVLIGHNIIRYDIPLLEKLLKIKVKATLVDTLPLSWTLFPYKDKHGLEYWGEDFGIKKPEISNWSNLPIETYIHRCSEDVKINTRLWQKQHSYLKSLYKDDKEINKYCQYLSFKMDCIREQEEIGISLDIGHCDNMLLKLSSEKEEKVRTLKAAMPKNPLKKKKVYKEAIRDEKGNIYTKGDLFYSFVTTNSLPQDIIIETITGYEEPNPNSHLQIKNWLYSLGWIPEHIKHVRDKKENTSKKIPQIASKFIPGEVCESIKKLFQKEPKLELLNGLSILSHRISIFKGFLEEQKEGKLYPTCVGLTNTLRLQHKIVVNLPGFDKKYGNEVRSCLIANKEELLCGSDLTNIEDRTKRHYIYKYDPKYVEEMNIEGFDAHLDIAILAGFLTKEEADEHKLYEKTKGLEGKSYKSIRHKAKTTNFSATYKVGAESLSRNANISLKEAKKLLEIYWKRNEAILKVEKDLKVKTIYGQKWLKNPISGFWYALRAEKDRFSTLNQGSAVFVFDTWVKYLRQFGIKISLQVHDEALFNINNKKETESIIQKSIEMVNEELKLNIQVGCSSSYGKTYSECH